jgi:oxygen-dependent protoporphyrinogen oxidase
VLGTPLLSWGDKLAAGLEVFRRPARGDADESVAGFVERHFSRGLLENIVDPLLNAVYGGDPAQLSARAVLPRMVEMAAKHGSLVRAMRQRAKPRSKERPPLFTTLRSGLGKLVGTLEEQLDAARILRSRRVTALDRSRRPTTVRLDSGETLRPRPWFWRCRRTSRLLQPLDNTLSRCLGEIPYSSSLIVALGYEAARLGRLPAGFGFLVPQKEATRLRACTFVDQKFPHRVSADHAARCFYGGTRDEPVVALNDAKCTEW